MDGILQDLEKSRGHLLGLLDDSDLNQVVMQKSGWRVRDVASHVAQWERIVGFAVEASLFWGTVAITPFEIHSINQSIFELHRDRSDDALKRLLESSREHFVTSLTQKGPDLEVLLPWGKSETVLHLAQDILGHERHHTQQIQEAMG